MTAAGGSQEGTYSVDKDARIFNENEKSIETNRRKGTFYLDTIVSFMPMAMSTTAMPKTATPVDSSDSPQFGKHWQRSYIHL